MLKHEDFYGALQPNNHVHDETQPDCAQTNPSWSQASKKIGSSTPKSTKTSTSLTQTPPPSSTPPGRPGRPAPIHPGAKQSRQAGIQGSRHHLWLFLRDGLPPSASGVRRVGSGRVGWGGVGRGWVSRAETKGFSQGKSVLKHPSREPGSWRTGTERTHSSFGGSAGGDEGTIGIGLFSEPL